MFGKADLERRLKVLDAAIKALTSRLELAEDDQRHSVYMRMVHQQRIEALEKKVLAEADANDRSLYATSRYIKGVEDRLDSQCGRLATLERAAEEGAEQKAHVYYADIYCQRAAEWGCTREVAKARMFAESLGYSPVYVSKLKDYVPQLKAAAERSPFKPGDRVGYVGPKGCDPKWYGIVCPRPAQKPQTSLRTGDRFVYVVTDHGDVYGCFADRLVRA